MARGNNLDCQSACNSDWGHIESIVAKAALRVASSSLSYNPGLSASTSFPKVTRVVRESELTEAVKTCYVQQ
jgi:hypothetical protein